MGIKGGFGPCVIERYPNLKERVMPWNMPVFDDFYFDTNTIIHYCSHAHEQSIYLRVEPDEIIKDILYFIDYMVKLVKPRKRLFIAVDGVAPRAKMNQQRARRFRSEKELLNKNALAIQNGESLPEGQCFDSNCITPGTEFMYRLHQRLKYFIADKISTDELWMSIEVFFSGCQVPGEGEHKIMEFIRYRRKQPDYDPYTRHCLYGLDVDLVMLSLATHEPYFTLLREEMDNAEKHLLKSKPEKMKFYLFSITLLRDYLEIEFAPIKNNYPDLFDLEKIVDDWVFMCMLVGNDFICHLPTYHLSKGSLCILFEAYIEVFSTLGGYINVHGKLNMKRLKIFLEKLAEFERAAFDNKDEVFILKESDIISSADLASPYATPDAPSSPSPSSDSMNRTTLSDKESYCSSSRSPDDSCSEQDAVEGERSQLTNGTDEEKPQFRPGEYLQNDEWELLRYNYYTKKFAFEINKETIGKLSCSYIEALQWNLLYYYEGCPSWSYFYPYHYSIYVTDMLSVDFSNFEFKFDLLEPPLPFEQLLSILPKNSSNLLPQSYQDVMFSKDMIEFYPDDFILDLNGKRFRFEAVVLIPFIDDEKLFKASEIAKKSLSNEETLRNKHEDLLLYSYTEQSLPKFASPEPGLLPDITPNHVHCSVISRDLHRLPSDQIRRGIFKEIERDKYLPGFPSLKLLNFNFEIRNERVRIFKRFSRSDNIILKFDNVKLNANSSSQLLKYLGCDMFYDYPFPKEGRLVGLFDGKDVHLYGQQSRNTLLVRSEIIKRNQQNERYRTKVQEIKYRLLERRGVEVTSEICLCIFQPLLGHTFALDTDGNLSKQRKYSNQFVYVLGQTVMPELKIVEPIASSSSAAAVIDSNNQNVTTNEKPFTNLMQIAKIFKVNRKCFVLDIESEFYGCESKILSYDSEKNELRIRVRITDEPDVSKVRNRQMDIILENYMTDRQIAAVLQLGTQMISKMTGSVFVSSSQHAYKNNIALNLKFKKKGQFITNFSTCLNGIWYFSKDVIPMIRNYRSTFPYVVKKAFETDVDPISPSELFPTGDVEKQYSELLEYLGKLPMKKERKKSLDAKILDRCVIGELEKLLRDWSSKRNTEQEMTINASKIYCSIATQPEIFHAHVDVSVFELYDRVVYVQSGTHVPQGLRGFVVEIDDNVDSSGNQMITVVFDLPFAGGLRINTQDKRAYAVPATHLLNISFGRLMRDDRTKSSSFAHQYNDLSSQVLNYQKEQNSISSSSQSFDSQFYDVRVHSQLGEEVKPQSIVYSSDMKKPAKSFDVRFEKQTEAPFEVRVNHQKRVA